MERWTSIDGELSLGVELVSYDGEHPVYRWDIACREADENGFTGGEAFAHGDDLRGGAGEADERRALASLGGFLGAWVESRDYAARAGAEGENVDLFDLSDDVTATVDAHADELACFVAEVEDD